ncbi:DUF2878 domain-containing protein [Vibrio sp. WXL103]|uniref:DUF2878 domain-containing protein n=1 Tax=unclassified Vibrio TaxID=2614977 RepID=UPI003EC72B4E
MNWLLRKPLITVSIWFQTVWFIAVLGRESGLLVLVLGLALGGWLISRAYQLRLEGVLLFMAIGLCVDSFNILIGLFVFESVWIPAWLLLLWLAFSLYAFVLLPGLNRLPKPLVVMFGGLGGCLSYLAGLKFGAVATTFNIVSFVCVLAVEWVLLLAIASYLIARFPLVQKDTGG